MGRANVCPYTVLPNWQFFHGSWNGTLVPNNTFSLIESPMAAKIGMEHSSHFLAGSKEKKWLSSQNKISIQRPIVCITDQCLGGQTRCDPNCWFLNEHKSCHGGWGVTFLLGRSELSSIQQAHRSRDCKIIDFHSQQYQNKIYIYIIYHELSWYIWIYLYRYLGFWTCLHHKHH